MENGGHKQMVQLENGTQRELSEAEKEEMLENEVLEEMAAETLRQEEQQMWEDFHAAEFRSWETWAAVQDDFLHGRKKRARVQVLVQGEGGRIIRRENWLFGLQEGERFSTVSVSSRTLMSRMRTGLTPWPRPLVNMEILMVRNEYGK